MEYLQAACRKKFEGEANTFLLSGDLYEVEHTICKIVITLGIDTSAIVLLRVYSINLDTIF